MTHLLKLSTWQAGSGRWYVSDIEDLGHNSGAWWYIPRMLGITIEEYFYLLKDKYKVDYIQYSAEKNVLIFSWREYTPAKKFMTYINKKARENKFFV